MNENTEQIDQIIGWTVINLPVSGGVRTMRVRVEAGKEGYVALKFHDEDTAQHIIRHLSDGSLMALTLGSTWKGLGKTHIVAGSEN